MTSNILVLLPHYLKFTIIYDFRFKVDVLHNLNEVNLFKLNQFLLFNVIKSNNSVDAMLN